MNRTEEIKNFANNEYKCIGSETDYTSTAAYEGIIKGATWADKTMIEKACEWLDHVNTDEYMDSGIFQMYDLIHDLKKAMEE